MEIPLTQGKVATIDDVDADLSVVTWSAAKARNTFYALHQVRKSDGKLTTESLHQVIARRMGIVGPPDHVDRNGLNNRRDNLRPAPGGRNQANRGRQSNNTSGFKSVSWNRSAGKWQARIQVDRKNRHLGYFNDPVEAAKTYDRAALEAFGEFAVLNFPAIASST